MPNACSSTELHPAPCTLHPARTPHQHATRQLPSSLFGGMGAANAATHISKILRGADPSATPHISARAELRGWCERVAALNHPTLRQSYAETSSSTARMWSDATGSISPAAQPSVDYFESVKVQLPSSDVSGVWGVRGDGSVVYGEGCRVQGAVCGGCLPLTT